MTDTVITDEQAANLHPKEDDREPIIPVQTRIDELEKAVGILMGFVKTVLPSDFQRFLKGEARVAERPDINVMRRDGSGL